MRPEHEQAIGIIRDMAETCRVVGSERLSKVTQPNPMSKVVEKLLEELETARTPICIGRPILGHLARDGQWVAEGGASVVAAADLFRKDPYERIAELEAWVKVICAHLRRKDKTLPTPAEVLDRMAQYHTAVQTLTKERDEAGELFQTSKSARKSLNDALDKTLRENAELRATCEGLRAALDAAEKKGEVAP